MPMTPIDADTAPEATGNYSQAMLVTGATRRLYVSGQIPLTRAGNVPATFKEQAMVAWQNVLAQLQAAGMAVTDLVKVTIFLSDRKYNLENRDVRQEILGAHNHHHGHFRRGLAARD
jgi:2-iminobutanoate/2-iminopropanoate deaminase